MYITVISIVLKVLKNSTRNFCILYGFVKRKKKTKKTVSDIEQMLYFNVISK